MTSWAASLDKKVVVEQPNPLTGANAVAYVSYVHPDGRKLSGIRTAYAAENDLLNYIAGVCAQLDALDDRRVAMDAIVAGATIVPGPIILPDLTKIQAIRTAEMALQSKLNAASQTKVIADATTIDPTVTDAVQALEDAKNA